MLRRLRFLWLRRGVAVRRRFRVVVLHMSWRRAVVAVARLIRRRWNRAGLPSWRRGRDWFIGVGWNNWLLYHGGFCWHLLRPPDVDSVLCRIDPA